MFDLDTNLKNKSEIVNEAFKKYLNESVSPLLLESMSYSVFAGGKRLRPFLVMTSWDMLSKEAGKYEKIVPLACAIEMIHTYSLIHDDLPSMDNDDLRRGKPTNHKVYGDAIAILAGDALLTEAFGVLTKMCTNFDPCNVIKLIQLMTFSAGSNGMVGGQVLDILNDGRKDIDEEYLEKTYNAKTGEMFTVSVIGPAVLLGQNDDIEILKGYGKSIGLAFQIIDDILSVVSTKEELGKSPHIDETNNKMTFVDLLGLKGARDRAKLEVERAKEVVMAYGAAGEPFITLADFILSRSY